MASICPPLMGNEERSGSSHTPSTVSDRGPQWTYSRHRCSGSDAPEGGPSFTPTASEIAISNLGLFLGAAQEHSELPGHAEKDYLVDLNHDPAVGALFIEKAPFVHGHAAKPSTHFGLAQRKTSAIVRRTSVHTLADPIPALRTAGALSACTTGRGVGTAPAFHRLHIRCAGPQRNNGQRQQLSRLHRRTHPTASLSRWSAAGVDSLFGDATPQLQLGPPEGAL